MQERRTAGTAAARPEQQGYEVAVALEGRFGPDRVQEIEPAPASEGGRFWKSCKDIPAAPAKPAAMPGAARPPG